ELSNEFMNPKSWYNLEIGVAPESGGEPKLNIKGIIAGVGDLVIKDFTFQPTNERSRSWYIFLAIFGVLLISTSMLTIIPKVSITYRRYIKRKDIYERIKDFITTCSLEHISVTDAGRLLLSFYEVDDDVSSYTKAYIAKIMHNEEELS